MNDKLIYSTPIDLGLAYRRLRISEPLVNFGSKAAIVVFFLFTAAAEWINYDNIAYAIEWLKIQRLGNLYVFTGKAMFVISMIVLGWRIILVLMYRPVKLCSDKELPLCTVIVPAYNEGRMVARTLQTVVKSDYPSEKLQIIAVDDGSVDDTWKWIQRAAERSDKIETIRLEKNSGKRVALYEGFIRSKGEVLVTIDSDSTIEPHAIRSLVSPFCVDPRIGAVAGSVKVLNRKKGFIPRMLDVSFAYSFEFIRAGQSVLGSVFCTPGALSAYRRGPLMESLPIWVHQTFMGRPATIGEDRAITNMILAKGFNVTFQADAVVFTNVPVDYSQLCKMFLRWARSNVRESIVMGAFIFKKFRKTSMLGTRINFLLSVLALTVPQFMLLGLFCCILWQPSVFLYQTVFCASVSGLIPACFFMLRRSSSDALWAIPYSIFWLFSLSWITLYSIFTAGNGNWLTRDIKPKEQIDIA